MGSDRCRARAVGGSGPGSVAVLRRPVAHVSPIGEIDRAYPEDVPARWWEAYGSPELNALMDQAIKASPEAAQKFNEMMGGLMSGSLSMNDLRAQAQSSINQIKAAKKELGEDDGGMLDSYLAILQKFMNESAVDTTVPAPPKPASPNSATDAAATGH